MSMKPIKVAVIGLGNCASSLVQGVAYYRKNNSAGGLIHEYIGGYGAGDVDFVMGVDVEMTFDPPWSADRMSEEAQVALGWY